MYYCVLSIIRQLVTITRLLGQYGDLVIPIHVRDVPGYVRLQCHISGQSCLTLAFATPAHVWDPLTCAAGR